MATRFVTNPRRPSARRNPDAATPRAFLSVLRSKLTQHDMKLSVRQPNMYRLGHYLAAAERVEKDMGKSLDSDSPAALEKLRQSLHKRFEMPFAPVSAVERQIDAYLTKGTMPSLVRKNPSSAARKPVARRRNPRALGPGVRLIADLPEIAPNARIVFRLRGSDILGAESDPGYYLDLGGLLKRLAKAERESAAGEKKAMAALHKLLAPKANPRHPLRKNRMTVAYSGEDFDVAQHVAKMLTIEDRAMGRPAPAAGYSRENIDLVEEIIRDGDGPVSFQKVYHLAKAKKRKENPRRRLGGVEAIYAGRIAGKSIARDEDGVEYVLDPEEIAESGVKKFDTLVVRAVPGRFATFRRTGGFKPVGPVFVGHPEVPSAIRWRKNASEARHNPGVLATAGLMGASFVGGLLAERQFGYTARAEQEASALVKRGRSRATALAKEGRGRAEELVSQGRRRAAATLVKQARSAARKIGGSKVSRRNPRRSAKDPSSREEFDLRYWGKDYLSVPAMTRREFYSDWRESGLSFTRYKRETSSHSDY